MDHMQERDFHRSLEPDVIINHEPSEDEEEDLGPRTEYASCLKDDLRLTDTNISDRKPPIKLRLFKKEYSPSKDDKKVASTKKRPRAPRTTVRIVSKDEAAQAGDTYARRKSLPLEKCPVCKKFFRRMKTHLLKHDQVGPEVGVSLTCSYCAKGFNTQSNLLIHMRTHTGDKPYVCDVCRKGFAQSCNLVNHTRIHTGERPFKCPHCDRAFTQSGNLNNHIRLHTDEKPFKCHFCDKAFVQSGNLNSHIRNNHKAPVEGGIGDEEEETDAGVGEEGLHEFKNFKC